MGQGARYGHAYRKWRAGVLASSDHCWICGRLVDKTAPYRDPETGQVNPRAASADHITPLANGGHIYGEGRLACMGCNSKRGAARDEHKTSRKW